MKLKVTQEQLDLIKDALHVYQRVRYYDIIKNVRAVSLLTQSEYDKVNGDWSRVTELEEYIRSVEYPNGMAER